MSGARPVGPGSSPADPNPSVSAHSGDDPSRDWTSKVPFSRSSYEGDGGWNDGRIGQAYDLISAVLTNRGDQQSYYGKKLLAEIEELDREQSE